MATAVASSIAPVMGVKGQNVCVCVRVCVCVSHMVQWYVQRFPIDRLRVRFPTIMVTHVFLLFLRLFLTFLSFSWVVTNRQCMPEYVV